MENFAASFLNFPFHSGIEQVPLASFFETSSNLYILREDQIHPFVSGNKFRKLKYNIEKAVKDGHNTLLTFGGAYSNHIAAVAAAGKLTGLQTLGIIRGEELSDKITENPTLSFAQEQGMQLHFITRKAYRDKYEAYDMIYYGGYIISDCDGKPDVLIFATGSEVWISLEAKDRLSNKYKVKIVNMACWELFEEQKKDYKQSVLSCSENTLLVSVEAGITDGWQKYTGRYGLNIGINTFGESAPGKDVADYFGLTANKVCKTIKNKIKQIDE